MGYIRAVNELRHCFVELQHCGTERVILPLINTSDKSLNLSKSHYHQYGRYWYIGMARVPHMGNTNMHGKISAKTERLAVKGCYYYYSAVSLSNKPKYMAGNHR